MNNIDVVYTPWENLKKTGDMAVGQVGYYLFGLFSVFVYAAGFPERVDGPNFQHLVYSSADAESYKIGQKS